ncbi:hypothetical protein [Vibrio mangrovi]|uniref:Uncharacterized protein n=1 Tax=Vibrio mangrovi TaxID=474394 RepID=A0ABU4IAG5_9VIBR|nr:hypothetical protein [Vibrio mangrovi]MDW6004844.1 hypothetical protein [Vibrio mangrovi]
MSHHKPPGSVTFHRSHDEKWSVNKSVGTLSKSLLDSCSIALPQSCDVLGLAIIKKPEDSKVMWGQAQ